MAKFALKGNKSAEATASETRYFCCSKCVQQILEEIFLSYHGKAFSLLDIKAGVASGPSQVRHWPKVHPHHHHHQKAQLASIIPELLLLTAVGMSSVPLGDKWGVPSGPIQGFAPGLEQLGDQLYKGNDTLDYILLPLNAWNLEIVFKEGPLLPSVPPPILCA